MTAFLWVEDFEGEQYREFAWSIFGKAFNVDASKFPNEENQLRAFLASRQIFLATSYAEAARLIDNRLHEIDCVVLDIDLNLMGEDAEDDLPLVLPLLERWYDYDSKAENEEASYSIARDRMKMVAGYHLYIDLVMNRNFSQSRILFCSNHGRHLERINQSFNPAKIEPPPIFEKADPAVGQWTCNQYAIPYLWLRRWITLACTDLQERLTKGEIRFRMPELSAVAPGQLTEEHAKILLETLPMLLPPDCKGDAGRLLAFRIFVRALTQDWDKIELKGVVERTDKAFSVVLKHARNWTSHDAIACSEMNEADLAFLFLIAMRVSFALGDGELERFETALLHVIGKAQSLDMVRLKQCFVDSFSCIQERFACLPERDAEQSRFFDGMVNELQKSRQIAVGEQMRYLMQIFWHQLHHADKNGFAPRLEYFNRTAFLGALTQCLYSRSF